MLKNKNMKSVSVFMVTTMLFSHMAVATALAAEPAPSVERVVVDEELEISVSPLELPVVSSSHFADVTEEIATDEFTTEEVIKDNAEEQLAPEWEFVSGISFVTYDIPYYEEYKGFKSFSRHTYTNGNSIYNPKYSQYALQQVAETNNAGFRVVNGRYCVAVGSYFNMGIGQYFDIVLENGIIIPCIMGDQKADCHTDEKNIMTLSNGCITEFIIDRNVMNSTVLQMGNVSYYSDEWQAKVVQIIVYEKNYFE